MTELIFLMPPLIFAVVIHEVAHGYVAFRLGDPTAKMRGRITLNPIAHVSVFGTLIIPGLLILTKAPILFGWAKPVPVNPNYFEKPLPHMAIVAAAGPISNFIQCVIYAGFFQTTYFLLGSEVSMATAIFYKVCIYGVIINTVLGMLNLIPVPPLDGGRIVAALLPKGLLKVYARLEPIGFFIVVIILYYGGHWIQVPLHKTITFLLGQDVF